MSLDHFPRNPHYGTGVYRRRIEVRHCAGRVLGKLDDTHHSMWLLIRHNGQHIITLEAGIERGPATSCGSAVGGVEALAGLSIRTKRKDFADRLPAPANCTHLMDLAWWMLRRATDQPGSVTFDIVVPDENGTPVWITVERDGVILHRWQAHDHIVLAPKQLSGHPLMRGFFSWASQTFEDPEAFEAAVMLHRGVFVARGRRHLVDQSPAIPLRSARGMRGACHSYAGSNYETATSVIGYTRDFTNGIVPGTVPDRILKEFIERRP